jgi:diketogulonate reductase-like aldo/keto reductase
MTKRPFGAEGPLVPILGQGTWGIERQPQQAAAALRRGLDLGLTHIDTAEMYGNGEVEKVVGQALGGHRAEVFLVSKVLPCHASRHGTIAACERSLRRLGTDYLDCYLLHWAGEHPFAETLAGFADLVDAGKIRSFGVSNFNVDELEEAVELAGPGRIACNQVLYHLGERVAEHRLISACAAMSVAFVAYSPFGSGHFPSPRSARGRHLAAVAARRGATPRQVALAFLTRHPSSFAIPKASKVSHTEENAGADRLLLSDRDLADLDDAFALGPEPQTLPTL